MFKVSLDHLKQYCVADLWDIADLMCRLCHANGMLVELWSVEIKKKHLWQHLGNMA